MKYLVMEVKDSYAVLLDEEGKMVYAANLHYEVGESIENPFLMEQQDENTNENMIKPNFLKRRVLQSIATIAACFVLVFGVFYYVNRLQPYVKIILSINPKVEMHLNRNGTVIRLKGINADGEQLVAGFNFKNRNEQEVSKALVARAAQMGYLKQGGTVSFTIDAPKPELYSQYVTDLQNCCDHDEIQEVPVDFELQFLDKQSSPSPTIEDDDDDADDSKNEYEDDDKKDNDDDNDVEHDDDDIDDDDTDDDDDVDLDDDKDEDEEDDDTDDLDDDSDDEDNEITSSIK